MCVSVTCTILRSASLHTSNYPSSLFRPAPLSYWHQVIVHSVILWPVLGYLKFEFRGECNVLPRNQPGTGTIVCNEQNRSPTLMMITLWTSTLEIVPVDFQSLHQRIFENFFHIEFLSEIYPFWKDLFLKFLYTSLWVLKLFHRIFWSIVKISM